MAPRADRSFVRTVRGPLTLITLGVLFALNNFTPYRFEQTWPVLLIVFGALSLIRRGTEPAPPDPGPQWLTPPPSGTPAGGYRQSTYTGTDPSRGTAAPPTSGGGQ